MGLEDVVERRIGDKKLGFGIDVRGRTQKKLSELLKEIQTEDLIKFGLIPEFIGRLPVITSLDELDDHALVKILTEPRNALVKQYQRLFEFEKVKLQFTSGSLEAIAREAIRRKSGARGLRAILESVMLDVMYDIPSQEGVREVLVSEDVIVKRAKPVLVYEKRAQTA